MNRSVVITGVGTVGAHGAGEEPLASALHAGEMETAEVDQSAGVHPRGASRRAGLISSGVLDPWLSPRTARRMSPASRFAVAASTMALESADLARDELTPKGTAVSLGTSFGSTSYTHRLLQQISDQGPLSVSPFLFMETVVNAHAGQVALALSATGPNYTISQREASGLLAVCRGAELVGTGRATHVFAGSVDEVSPIQHAALGAHGALAKPAEADGQERAKVFDADRSGFVISEGSTVLVLEDEETARGRGAPIRARIRAVVRANDTTATTTDWGEGHLHLASAVKRRLGELGVDVGSIDRVVSGASGSRKGDLLEAQTLRGVFGEQGVPTILAPKSVTGEYGGGFLAAALSALESVEWAATPGFEREDPSIALRPHDGTPLPPAERVLVTSLAAGGAGAWVVLDRVG